MESYTEIKSVNFESPTKAKSIETEEIRTLEEGKFTSSARPTKTEHFDSSQIVAYFPDEFTGAILSWEEIIPVGTEIKTIKFKYNDTWVDIHELNILDSRPYALNISKCYEDSETIGGYVLAIVGIIGSMGVILTAMQSENIKEIEVVYYTDRGVE